MNSDTHMQQLFHILLLYLKSDFSVSVSCKFSECVPLHFLYLKTQNPHVLNKVKRKKRGASPVLNQTLLQPFITLC